MTKCIYCHAKSEFCKKNIYTYISSIFCDDVCIGPAIICLFYLILSVISDGRRKATYGLRAIPGLMPQGRVLLTRRCLRRGAIAYCSVIYDIFGLIFVLKSCMLFRRWLLGTHVCLQNIYINRSTIFSYLKAALAPWGGLHRLSRTPP